LGPSTITLAHSLDRDCPKFTSEAQLRVPINGSDGMVEALDGGEHVDSNRAWRDLDSLHGERGDRVDNSVVAGLGIVGTNSGWDFHLAYNI
jgi:hypothetical protein